MTLTPEYAAGLANDVYLVKTDATRKGFVLKYKNDMELTESASVSNKPGSGKLSSGVGLTGETGALVLLKSTHTMGVASFGKSPKYNKEAFIAIKGTASLFDGLTDANAGLKRFHSGGLVHQGFFYTFESFLPQLKSFAQQCVDRGISTVHCIGHSLGGALATLVSDWLTTNLKVNVELYTFGSPRVGMSFFSEGCCSRVGPANIFRVFHNLDPVPMVPTWPFSHVTDSREDYRMPCSMAQSPVKYHSAATYVKNVKKASGNWDILKAYNEPEILEKSVISWLESDGPVSFSLNTAKVLNAALLWVLNKISEVIFIGVVGAGATAFTLLDRLAYMMHRAYEFGEKVGYWVERLMKKMAKMLGFVVNETVNFTYSFIRSLFLRMFHHINDLTRQASKTIF